MPSSWENLFTIVEAGATPTVEAFIGWRSKVREFWLEDEPVWAGERMYILPVEDSQAKREVIVI